MSEDIFDGFVDIDAGIVDVRLGGPAGARDVEREKVELAALLLRGYFTHEDVDLLRLISDTLDAGHDWPGGPFSSRHGVTGGSPNVLRDIADRIEALLPPRTEAPNEGTP